MILALLCCLPGLRHATAKSGHVWDEMRDLRTFDPERWLVLNRNPETGQQETAFGANVAPLITFGRANDYSTWSFICTHGGDAGVLAVWHFINLLDVLPVLAGPKAS